MVKKLFALASVTALTGVFTAGAGCSSTTETTTTADAATDVKAEASKKDGTAEEDSGETVDPNCPKTFDFVEADLDKELGGSFKAPAGIRTGACSQQDLTTFEANFKNTNLKEWKDLGTGLSTGCSTCIFSETNAANWGVIVLFSDDTTKGFVNYGACHAAVNNSASCGQAFQYDQFCVNFACGDCAAAAEDTCIGKTWEEGSCKTIHTSIPTRCPQFTKSNKDCGNSAVQHAAVVCGSGIADGGPG